MEIFYGGDYYLAILKDLIVHGPARILNTLFAKRVVAEEFEGSLKASDVVIDSTHRFVTDTEKTAWNGKANTTVVSQSVNGLMAAADKKKLDGIATSANNYVHPNSGAAAGTYRSVAVNAQGHVTGGTNPTTLSGYGITDAAAKVHTHTKSQITDMPTSLKNPEILNILFNGMPWTYYDGSSRVEIDVTPGNIGAAESGHKHSPTGLKSCMLPASGWSNTTPYTQRVSVSGITSNDNPVISLDLPDGISPGNESDMLKAYSCLSSATTGNGSITFKCVSKKPTSDFYLSVLVF